MQKLSTVSNDDESLKMEIVITAGSSSTSRGFQGNGTVDNIFGEDEERWDITVDGNRASWNIAEPWSTDEPSWSEGGEYLGFRAGLEWAVLTSKN